MPQRDVGLLSVGLIFKMDYYSELSTETVGNFGWFCRIKEHTLTSMVIAM